MEQLSSSAIRQLLLSTRTGDGSTADGSTRDGSTGDGSTEEGSAAATSPEGTSGRAQPDKTQLWARREGYGLSRPEPLPGSYDALVPGLYGDEASPPGGIERRLVRRAEALWANMKPDTGLPLPSATVQFLAAPLSGQALLIAVPEGARPVLVFAGEGIAAIARVEPGPMRADGGLQASLGERLAALAVQAVANGSPALLDSDFDAPAGSGRRPHLLLRAIALPFAADPAQGCASTAIVVASWRKLLSAEETAALHRELAAAIDWMHASKP